MKKTAILIHIGRLHIKIFVSPEKANETLNKIQENVHTDEWRTIIEGIYNNYPGEWTEAWAKQTKDSMDKYDYVIELGDEDTHLLPDGWHKRFGEGPLPQPPTIYKLKIKPRYHLGKNQKN